MTRTFETIRANLHGKPQGKMKAATDKQLDLLAKLLVEIPTFEWTTSPAFLDAKAASKNIDLLINLQKAGKLAAQANAAPPKADPQVVLAGMDEVQETVCHAFGLTEAEQTPAFFESLAFAINLVLRAHTQGRVGI